MWKESLRIGIDKIDQQHKALFDKIEELGKETRSGSADSKQKCIDAILFLKDYTARHFADEEEYQQSIGYSHYEEHKKLHEGFIKTLAEHEKILKASDFADSDVKAFTGMLMAWLLYHVADRDQKIGKEAVAPIQHDEHYDMMFYAVCDVLQKMAGYDTKKIKAIDDYSGTSDDTFSIEVSLTGGVSGYFVYTFPIVFIKELMNAIMGYDPEVIGEMEISTLFEISNIVSGTIGRQISYSHNVTCDLSAPYIAEASGRAPGEKVTIDTGSGVIDTEISVIYK